jgi:Flp pilus assembly protein TadD
MSNSTDQNAAELAIANGDLTAALTNLQTAVKAAPSDPKLRTLFVSIALRHGAMGARNNTVECGR